MKFITIIDNEIMDLKFSPSMDNITVRRNKIAQKIDCVPLSANSFSLILNGRTYYLTIRSQLDGYEVSVNHHTHLVKVKDQLQLLLEKFGMNSEVSSHAGEIHAQIPGLVSRVFIKLGDKVKAGDKLCILEAMKMENEIPSPKNGTVSFINIVSGTNVEKGALLMKISD